MNKKLLLALIGTVLLSGPLQAEEAIKGDTDKTKVVSATIWVTDIRLRDPMNEAWNAWTKGENLPGRACIEAKLADPRLLVEIAVVAAK